MVASTKELALGIKSKEVIETVKVNMVGCDVWKFDQEALRKAHGVLLSWMLALLEDRSPALEGRLPQQLRLTLN